MSDPRGVPPASDAPPRTAPEEPWREEEVAYGPVRGGVLSERALDAMAQQVAAGTPRATVAAAFGMKPERFDREMDRPEMAERIDEYRARFQAQASMNLTRIYLHAGRILSNVLESAEDRKCRWHGEAVKLVWPVIVPVKQKVELEVAHTLEPELAREVRGTLVSLRDVLSRAREVPAMEANVSSGPGALRGAAVVIEAEAVPAAEPT